MQPEDSYFLKLFYKDIGCVKELDYYLNKDYQKCYPRAYVQHPHLSQTMLKLGVPNDKSFKINFPNDNIVPNNLKQHFIRGYFDGDGSLTSPANIGKIAYSFAGNHQFLSGLQQYLICNIADYKESKLYKTKSKIFTFSHGGRFVTQKFLDWLYKDATIFLERKHDIYLKLLEYNSAIKAA